MAARSRPAAACEVLLWVDWREAGPGGEEVWGQMESPNAKEGPSYRNISVTL